MYLDYLDDENRIEIEWCVNDEWLTTIGGYESDPDLPESSDLSEDARAILRRIYDDLLLVDEIRIVNAQDGRSQFHQWNGARWAWHHGPVGAFEPLPADLRQRIEHIIDDAESEVTR